MSNVCLVVIYNHNYEKNISVIKNVYKGRFSNVFQVMPFYRGTDPSVIGVYEGSFQFNGYIAQASRIFVRPEFDYYVFVADDMVLNPRINERNIVRELNLNEETGIITRYKVFEDSDYFNWPVGRVSTMHLNAGGNMCEWRQFMPSISEARRRFANAGLDWRKGLSKGLYQILRCGLRGMRQTPWYLAEMFPFSLARYFVPFFLRGRSNLPLDTDKLLYPTAWGYSDFFVVPKGAMSDFSHYCGVLAATHSFVEVSIPTALVLSCARLVSISDIGWNCETGVDDYAVRVKMECDCELSYQKLVDAFPSNYLFIHPIKLSKWRNLP